MAPMTLPAELENLNELLDFICDNAKAHHLGEEGIGKLRLVSEEALVNIINYAFPEKKGDINVTCNMENNDEFWVEVRDQGIAFNILENPKPDLDAPLEDRKVGGLGIFFISELTDHVSYKRENGSNVLTFLMNVK